MIIDATRQMKAEGGPENWSPLNRELFVKEFPDALEQMGASWDEWMAGYKA